MYNRAVELYNHTDHDVDLSEYRLVIYNDGSEEQPLKFN